MNTKIVILAFAFILLSISRILGQADPGTAGLQFDKSILTVNETTVIYVSLGNFASRLIGGNSVNPLDARFTIALPAELRIHGPIDKSLIPFNINISSSVNQFNGLTTIIVTVPNGIPLESHGELIIPVIAYKQNIDIVTVASVKTESSLSDSPSGNASTSNDMYSAPVAVFSALPVTLVSFKVDVEESAAMLSWSTTEETGSDRFDVEHSMNGKQWSKIGSVVSTGESTVRRDYQFSHNAPDHGNNYYRLKMVDKNMTFAYSAIRNIMLTEEPFAIFPNPTSETLTINTPQWENVVNVQLINSNAMSVYNSGKAPQRMVVVANLISGIYSVKLTKLDGSVFSQKVMVNR